MRATSAGGFALLLAGLAVCGAAAEDMGPDVIPPDDPAVLELVAAIDAAGTYDVPDIELRKDDNYAKTSVDVEPFSGVKPWKENFLLQIAYRGPGRGRPDPEGLDSVKLGFIGPIEATVSVATGGKNQGQALGIPMLRGSQLAVEHWNARGGYRGSGTPFELVVSNDNGLWGASGNEIVNQAYKDGVWGILGTIDGANSHIAIRVALKAELLMINTGDTDPTFIETNIPWVARVISDDRQQAYLLADYWYRKLGFERVAVVRASSRYGRFGVREVTDSSRRLGHPVPIEMAYEPGQEDLSLELERVQAVRPDAVVHWGDAEDGARLLRQMRARGMQQPFYGCDRTVSDAFVELAGEHAEGVVAAYPWNPASGSARLERFRRAYRERFDAEPGTYAAHAYDGMNIMLWATQVAGLNRAKIRDVVAHLPRPWPGVTGDVVLSAALDDVGETTLAFFEDGRWRYRTREDLDIPRGDVPPRDRLQRSETTAR